MAIARCTLEAGWPSRAIRPDGWAAWAPETAEKGSVSDPELCQRISGDGIPCILIISKLIFCQCDCVNIENSCGCKHVRTSVGREIVVKIFPLLTEHDMGMPARGKRVEYVTCRHSFLHAIFGFLGAFFGRAVIPRSLPVFPASCCAGRGGGSILRARTNYGLSHLRQLRRRGVFTNAGRGQYRLHSAWRTLGIVHSVQY